MSSSENVIVSRNSSSPAGRTRIMQSLAVLLETKEFSRITTSEIARNAEVTEGLIYKYFSDKRELLYQVLHDLFSHVIHGIEDKLNTDGAAQSKLYSFIKASIESYDDSRVFSKIIFLEVRSSPSFFTSSAYQLVQHYSRILDNIIEEGISSGEFAADIHPRTLRESILGAIEHACLSSVLFERDIAVEEITERICRIILAGIVVSDISPQPKGN